MPSAALLLLALAAAPATAPPPAPHPDPNQMICAAQSDTASRIVSHRMCRTRAEWEAYRREMRSSVERFQGPPRSQCNGMMGMGC